MAGIGDALLVNTGAGDGGSQVNANAPSAGADSKQVSNFVTAQSLATFAVAAPVLKTIWELIKSLAGGWADSYWTPLVICLVYGAWQFIISVWGEKKLTSFTAILSAAITAAANAGILAASIIGLTETTGAGET
jgi:hypothetical protein